GAAHTATALWRGALEADQQLGQADGVSRAQGYQLVGTPRPRAEVLLVVLSAPDGELLIDFDLAPEEAVESLVERGRGEFAAVVAEEPELVRPRDLPAYAHHPDHPPLLHPHVAIVGPPT